MIAARDGFSLLDLTTGTITLVAEVAATIPATLMNDGKCDAEGRFWAGTKDVEGRRALGSLFRLDADLSLTRVLTGVTISNGLDWSPDGLTMYYIDSAAYGIDAFAVERETGSLSHRRRLVELPKAWGLPDGMTVDEEGCLWVAFWTGVRRPSLLARRPSRVRGHAAREPRHQLRVRRIGSLRAVHHVGAGRPLGFAGARAASRRSPVPRLARRTGAGRARVRAAVVGRPIDRIRAWQQQVQYGTLSCRDDQPRPIDPVAQVPARWTPGRPRDSRGRPCATRPRRRPGARRRPARRSGDCRDRDRQRRCSSGRSPPPASSGYTASRPASNIFPSS